MKRYFHWVKGINGIIGRVIEYLDTSRRAENTVVIYNVDQGIFLGEHGLPIKLSSTTKRYACLSWFAGPT